MASHSVGATTPTRLPFTMTCEFGNLVLSSWPTDTRVEPSVFGCTTRPCNIPGRRTSVAQVSFAVTLEMMMEFGSDLPMTVYSLTGFIGGFPSTLNPKMLVRAPRTGTLRLHC